LSRGLGFGQTNVRTVRSSSAAVDARQFCNASPLGSGEHCGNKMALNVE
jgi:hypothetical protein